MGVVVRALLAAGSVYELSAGIFFFCQKARYIKQLDYENVMVDEGAVRVTFHAQKSRANNLIVVENFI